jgi:hypothetical protein
LVAALAPTFIAAGLASNEETDFGFIVGDAGGLLALDEARLGEDALVAPF